MKTSIEQRHRSESYEGLRLIAYQDSGGIWTIGYGHTGKDVHSGQTITKTQADALFATDLVMVEAAINHNVQVEVSQNKFDALVDFGFNCGVGRLVRKLVPLVNARQDRSVMDTIMVYTKDHNGVVLAGLLRRRTEEARLYGQP